MRGRLWITLCVLLTVVAGLGAPSVRAGTERAPTAEPLIEPTIAVAGKGFGHGRGMGQWGAYGYAVAGGWSWQQILDHYYGGTTSGGISLATDISVELRELSGAAAIGVEHRGKRLVADAVGGEHGALRAVLRGDGLWDLEQASTCGGPWALIAAGVGPAGVRFDVAGGADQGASVPDALLGLCEPDGQTRYYRGSISAVNTASGTRAVNVVRMEAYLRGVVPREVEASWGDDGNGAGMHTLRAQAVAARSYAASQRRYAHAQTCDTQSCQVYRAAWVRNADGSLVALEAAATDQAIADTAGVVRVFSNGNVASTEFSASSGGWTAGGAFPAVKDDGDELAAAISAPAARDHDWLSTIATSTVEARYPELGGLVAIEVTRRNGLGEYGGRVLEVVLRGNASSRTMSGWDFRTVFGLKSDWFAVGEDATCGSGGSPPPSVALPEPVPTTFHPLVPARVLDTRDGTGAIGGRLGGGCTLVVQATGRGGVPSDGVSAVTLNLTATEAVEDGYLTAYPCGGAFPPTSSVNYRLDVTTANLVTVPVGAGGQVCVFAYRTVHVVADVSGWWGIDASGARLHGLAPERFLDTRDGTGIGGARQEVPAGGVVAVDIAGRGPVPSVGAGTTAVVLNLTATEPSGAGYLSAFPCASPAYASALNYDAGATVANQVMVPVDGSGRVCILSSSAGHVIADVLGYYGAPGAGGGDRFTPLRPDRIHDTRIDLPPGVTWAGAGTTAAIDVLGRGGVPSGGVSAVMVNLTAADPAAAGYLSAHPCGSPPPNASNVNHVADRAAGNSVTVPLGGDGRVCVFTFAATDIVVDVFGFFAA